MNKDNLRAPNSHIRSGWNDSIFLFNGPLTDRRIEEYRKRGYYDPAFREARKEAWARKEARRTRRDGNFDLIDGRMVYRP